MLDTDSSSLGPQRQGSYGETEVGTGYHEAARVLTFNRQTPDSGLEL